MGISRNRHEPAGREPLGVTNVKGVAHSYEERPGEYGDLFIGRMGVRAHGVAVGQLEPDRERTGLAGITLEHREAGVSGQKVGARTPLHCLGRRDLSDGNPRESDGNGTATQREREDAH